MRPIADGEVLSADDKDKGHIFVNGSEFHQVFKAFRSGYLVTLMHFDDPPKFDESCTCVRRHVTYVEEDSVRWEPINA